MNVRYIFDEDLVSAPGDDVLIVDKPKMATKAVPNANSTAYESVTVMTNHEWIAELEDNRAALFAASYEWTQGCLKKRKTGDANHLVAIKKGTQT